MKTLQAIFKNKKETNDGSANAPRYGCPMRCEGDKTYDQPGNCPVCNMKLVPVDRN